jgi:tRNA(adenine34) deaminase
MQDSYRPLLDSRSTAGPPNRWLARGEPMNYELYMAEAIAEARRGAEEGENPVGAVAVIDDAMIARDHHRVALSEDPTAHAVLLTVQAAARKLGTRRLAEATIFTTHEPCAMCVGALLETRVRALVFAVPDPERGAAGSVIQLARDPSLGHQLSVVSGVRESEARRLAPESASV